MPDFVKAGSRLINLENVAHVRVWHREENEDRLIVDVATLATAGKDIDGEPVEVIVVLEDAEAQEFLDRLYYRGPDGHR